MLGAKVDSAASMVDIGQFGQAWPGLLQELRLKGGNIHDIKTQKGTHSQRHDLRSWKASRRIWEAGKHIQPAETPTIKESRPHRNMQVLSTSTIPSYSSMKHTKQAITFVSVSGAWGESRASQILQSSVPTIKEISGCNVEATVVEY